MARGELTIDDLRSDLKRKKFSPVYLFHGEEDFLADEAIELIIASSLTPEQRGFNLDVVYGSDADARDIVSHASSFPLMAERRVVVVRDVDKLGNKEILSTYIEQPAPMSSLVLQSAKLDLRKKPYVTVKRSGMVIRFDPIRDYQIGSWIGARAKDQGWEIDPEAVKMLAAYVGTSLREIQNELDKLYIFLGQKRKIVADDIRAVVGVSKEYNIFELQNAIGAKNLTVAMEILTRMLDAGESPVLVVVMLTRFFTTLWKLHELRRRGVSGGELAGAIGVNPYFVKDYLEASGNYPLPRVERAFETLLAADEEIKSSSQDSIQIMQSMLVRLMQHEEPVLA